MSFIIAVLFDGHRIIDEYRMPELIPVIRQPKPVDLVFHPRTYYNDFRQIESIDYEYVGKLPDGRYLYALVKK